MGVVVSSSHVVYTAPSSSGKGLLTVCSNMGFLPWRQFSMKFSNVSPSHGLKFFTNCSSVGPFHRVQSFRNRLLQHGFPTGSQSPLGIHLLQRGVLHRLQWISAPLWTSLGCRGRACLTIVFTMSCRGISALVPGACPPPPSSLTLVSS